MEREEEIRQASHEYINSDTVKAGGEYFAFGDFIRGAKWADEHPRKGLVDIEKVCEWLEEYSSNYMVIHNDGDPPFVTFDSNWLVDNLKKAMNYESNAK